jgi:hypothetical protein
MALKKPYEFTLDLKSENSLSLPNIVSGDTGNVFIIHIKDDDVAVDLTDARVRLVITNKDGQGAQDTEVSPSGIDMSEAASGTLTIDVFSTMISNGVNTGCVEVYTTVDDQWDTLSTTNDFNFTATNSPSEKATAYPSLVQAEARFKALLAELQYYIGLFNPDNCVHYTAQEATEDEQQIARANIAAALASHVHGSLQTDGTVSGGRTLALVETDASGNLVAARRIIVTSQDPTTLTGLSDNDIVLYDHA